MTPEEVSFAAGKRFLRDSQMKTRIIRIGQ
jgi:hypothetical protein